MSKWRKLPIFNNCTVFNLFIDSSDPSAELPVLKKGTHKIRFCFVLKDMELPSSFESKLGTIRYLLHTSVNIPYASPPQNVKYFSVIGRQQESPPHEWPVGLLLLSDDECFSCCPFHIFVNVNLMLVASFIN